MSKVLYLLVTGKRRWHLPLLLLLCGCGVSGTKPEQEPVLTIHEAISTANALADAMQGVRDANSARAAAADIESKVKQCGELQRRIPQVVKQYKNVDVSEAQAEQLKRDMTQALARVSAEAERIERLRSSGSAADWACMANIDLSAYASPGKAKQTHSAGVSKPKPDATAITDAQPPTKVNTPDTHPADNQVKPPQTQPAAEPETVNPFRRESTRVVSRMGVVAPLDRNDPEYYEKLADRMVGDDRTLRREALDVLLRTEPDEVKAAETRKKIARGFRQLALDRHGNFDRGRAVEGLTRWGGKFAVPVLLDILDEEHSFVQDDVYRALGDLKDEAHGRARGGTSRQFLRTRAHREMSETHGPGCRRCRVGRCLVTRPENDPHDHRSLGRNRHEEESRRASYHRRPHPGRRGSIGCQSGDQKYRQPATRRPSRGQGRDVASAVRSGAWLTNRPAASSI